MAGGTIPHFQNDAGHATIDIGVKEFMCVGANPPFDHPHVFLDMGSDDNLVLDNVISECGRNGVLEIRVAKPEEAKPRKIQVAQSDKDKQKALAS